MLKKITKYSASILGTFILLLVPVVVSNSASFIFWGEPECPDCLKSK